MSFYLYKEPFKSLFYVKKVLKVLFFFCLFNKPKQFRDSNPRKDSHNHDHHHDFD